MGLTYFSANKQRYEVSGAGFLILSNVLQTVDLSTVIHANSDFSVVLGVITYTGPTRTFNVTYSVTGNATNNSRSTANHVLTTPTGTPLVRSSTYTYHRLAVGDGQTSASKTILLTLSSGNTVALQSRKLQNQDAVTINIAESNITFIEV